MAFETELANIAHQTDVISDAISAALVQAIVALPFVAAEDLPTDTNVKLFRKDGSLVAEIKAESGSYVFSANSEFIQTTVTSTALKQVCVSKLTVEAEQFSSITQAKIMEEQGKAIGRLLDDDVLALFAGFSVAQTAASTATVEDLVQAAYLVRSGTAGVGQLPLIGILEYKQIVDMQAQIIATDATPFSLESQITLIQGVAEPSGRRGHLAGVELYETNGVPTNAGDHQGLVFDPALAMAGMVSPSVNVRTDWRGSDGFWNEISSWVFSDFVEWNDEAGIRFESDV